MSYNFITSEKVPTNTSKIARNWSAFTTAFFTGQKSLLFSFKTLLANRMINYFAPTLIVF